MSNFKMINVFLATITAIFLHAGFAFGQDALSVDANGNVGIGTLTPGSLLNIADNDSVGAPQIRIQQDGTGDAALVFTLPGTKNYSMGIDNSDGNKFKITLIR